LVYFLYISELKFGVPKVRNVVAPLVTVAFNV